MSARSPIQVPEELKNKIEGMKQKFNAGSIPAVIEKLAEAYERNAIERVREKEQQAQRMIDVGAEGKQDFANFRAEMGFKSDARALAFLLEHYNNSDSISKKTLALYRDLQD
jgi:hypothetical protein